MLCLKNPFLPFLVLVFSAVLFFGCSTQMNSSSRGTLPLSPGMVFHRSISLESDFQIPIAGVQADLQKSRLLLQCEVLTVAPDQFATLKITIEKLTASLKSLGIFCQYDSASPSILPANPIPPTAESNGSAGAKKQKLQAQYEKNFEGLTGSTFLAHLDIKNRQIRLDIQDPKLSQWVQRQPTGMIGPDQLSLLLSWNSLCEYLDPEILQNLPENLKSGSSWTSIVWLETPKAPAIPVLKTCTVESITSDLGNSIATVNFTLTSQIPDSEKQAISRLMLSAPPAPPKPAFQVLSLTGTGQTRIDLFRRTVLTSTLDYQAYIRSADSQNQSSASADIPPKSNTSYRIRQTIEHLP